MKLRTTLLLVVLLVALGCKEQKKEPAVEEAEKAALEPKVKLYTFSGGTLLINNLELFAQDSVYRGQRKEFADAFYVISHPKGNLMWDAGLPEALIAMDEPFTSPDGNFTVSRKDSVANQLRSIGLSIDDINYIALSHTHFDHSGHANVFSGATWLVQAQEYDFITSEESKKNNADNYNAISALSKVKQLHGDHDVFGDESVIIKAMPGHTPGHQVLYIDLAEHGPLLLSGDLYHLYENRTHKRVPIFNSNVEQTLASMDAFEKFATEKEAKVYLQHQKEDFEKMPKAPKYLK